MKRITITVSDETAEAIKDLAKACSAANEARDGFTSHGNMTPAKLLAMLAEDAGMVITRPGCWEAENLYQALVCHGYGIRNLS